MVGHVYTSKERRADIAWAVAVERVQCAKIAEKIATETPDGEGEIYIARKIADAIRARE